jgi:predicted phosphodiesterase
MSNVKPVSDDVDRESFRVAALFDIHGNLPALEAVIRDVRHLGVDAVIVGGDIVPGPMPREVLGCLSSLDVPTKFIVGNGEVAVLQQIAGIEPSKVPTQHRPLIQWCADEMIDYRDILAAWPKTVALGVSGVGTVLFCHATPRDENEIFTRLTPEDRLAPIFRDLDVQVVVCGHTHMQFDRMIGTIRVMNAGSVGMPFGKTGADWLVIGSEIEFRNTSYDLKGAADRIRLTKYPEAETFATASVLRPPSEAEMLKLFSRAELT